MMFLYDMEYLAKQSELELESSYLHAAVFFYL